MKQHSIDKATGITYTLQGDYYLPDLLPAQEAGRPSAYGDSDTYGISNSTARCFMLTC